MSSTTTFNWPHLPHEMQLAVLENLSLNDVWACSRASRDSYSVCLSILFRTVKLPTFNSLLEFLEAVPSHRYSLIRDLSICTKSPSDDLYEYDAFTRPSSPEASGPIATLLSHCTSLDSLSLSVYGSLASEVVLPVFKGLGRLKRLRLENLEQEEIRPFSERLAVSLAFSLPSLEELSLTRITRSAKHAHELQWSNVPIVQGDDSIPAHSLLGDELRLPQLFRLPNLKRLRIRDTHLGDPLWAGPELGEANSDACCPLEVLDLGSCAHVSPSANEMHTARILARVPSSITACALSASLPPSPSQSLESPPSPNKSNGGNVAPNSASSPSSTYSCPPLPSLPHLRTLHLTPLVPTSSLGSTLSQPTLASSPVHTLSCAFHPDDAAEGCAALEAFLLERARTGVKSGRKRSSSKLNLCSEPESFITDAPDVDACATPVGSESGSGAAPKPRARANTAPVSTPVLSGSVTTAPAQLYPSLRTLAIDIPSEETSSQSPGAKLSPRRLAAARRRAEVRRTAAHRVQALAQELGLEVILRGLGPDDTGAVSAVHDVPASAKIMFGEKPAVGTRVRANSA
ncbi:hypothetical protein M0805_009778 [Coniferiporia weirii]|nr:hypothetical protein M0805_009778 [Coniferiporia weirii]